MLKQVNELTEDQKISRRERIENMKDIEVTREERHVSPCGTYMLLVEGRGRYAVGVIYKKDEIIGRVHRNYGSFPFSWVCDHPADGHDYLVCSENYTGQTIVRLDTGERVDYRGTGWIWATHIVSSDKTEIACEGCHWGGEYRVKVFDFTDPMAKPGLPLFEGDGEVTTCEWNSDGTLTHGYTYEHNLVFDKPEFDETEEELTHMEKLEKEGHSYSDLYEDRQLDNQIWKRS